MPHNIVQVERQIVSPLTVDRVLLYIYVYDVYGVAGVHALAKKRECAAAAAAAAIVLLRACAAAVLMHRGACGNAIDAAGLLAGARVRVRGVGVMYDIIICAAGVRSGLACARRARDQTAATG